ncbi:MAG: hypothetical protein JSU73_04825, partial [candidate division WOR-3 bacterium]
MQKGSTLFLTMLAVGVVTAQLWEFEQVDTMSTGRVTVCRHPDGRTILGYGAVGLIRLAWKDSTWHYESTGCPGRSDFCIGPDGTMGIAYVPSDSARLCYAMRTDTGWQHETLPWCTDGGTPRLGMGPEGCPGILYVLRDDTLLLSALLLASRTQDSWRLDTVWAVVGTPGAYFGAYGFAYDTLGRASGLYRRWRMEPNSRDDLHIFYPGGGQLLVMGFENYIGSAVMGLEPGGRWAALYSNVVFDTIDWLYYRDSDPESGVCLDSSALAAAVGFDTAGR